MSQRFLAASGRLLLLTAILAAHGCSDDSSPSDPSATSATTGAGGAGTGGAGGGASGGGGATNEHCLDPSRYAAVIDITVPDLCVVAQYDAPFAVASYAPPTWGRHGGPMVLAQGFAGADPADEVTITRWLSPSDATGSLSVHEVVGPLSVGASAAVPFFSAIATDLVGTPWTLVAYADSSFAGELVALEGVVVADRWEVSGYYWGAALSGAEARLVHTSQGPLEAGAGTAGLYAADFCAGPALCAAGGAAIDSWGNANGPVAADVSGNVVAVQIDFTSGMQTLRGYFGQAVAHGKAGVAGTDLLTVAGFGSSLAALAPTASEAGWALFQPQTFDGNEVLSDPVIGVRFDVAGESLVAVGEPTTAIATTAPGAEVTLMSDAEGRIWLGIATGPASSSFFVIDRAH